MPKRNPPPPINTSRAHTPNLSITAHPSPEPLSMDILQRITFGLLGARDEYAHASPHSARSASSSVSAYSVSPPPSPSPHPSRTGTPRSPYFERSQPPRSPHHHRAHSHSHSRVDWAAMFGHGRKASDASVAVPGAAFGTFGRSSGRHRVTASTSVIPNPNAAQSSTAQTQYPQSPGSTYATLKSKFRHRASSSLSARRPTPTEAQAEALAYKQKSKRDRANTVSVYSCTSGHSAAAAMADVATVASVTEYSGVTGVTPLATRHEPNITCAPGSGSGTNNGQPQPQDTDCLVVVDKNACVVNGSPTGQVDSKAADPIAQHTTLSPNPNTNNIHSYSLSSLTMFGSDRDRPRTPASAPIAESSTMAMTPTSLHPAPRTPRAAPRQVPTPTPTRTPASPTAAGYLESVKRQRSFLRSITNHASISALRNRTWKRKDIPIPALEAAEESSVGHGSTNGSHDTHTGNTATIKIKSKLPTTPSIRRLRPKSLKRSKSNPTVDAPPLPSPPPPLPRHSIAGTRTDVANPNEPGNRNGRGHSQSHGGQAFWRRALSPTQAEPGRMSPATPVPSPLPRVRSPISATSPPPTPAHPPVLPPLPPATPFLRRLGNRAPTEVGLEFGTTPSPQSDRVRPTTPGGSLSHRRYKSEECGSNSLQSSLSSVASSPPPRLPQKPIPYRALTPVNGSAGPSASGSSSTTPGKYVDAVEVADTSATTTESSLASIGSFDINVLDRLLEAERGMIDGVAIRRAQHPQQSRLREVESRSSESSASGSRLTEQPTKHTRHSDIFGVGTSGSSTDGTSSRRVPSGASMRSASFRSSSFASARPGSALSTRSVHVPQFSPLERVIGLQQHAQGSGSSYVSSIIESDVDEAGNVVPFRTDESRSFVHVDVDADVDDHNKNQRQGEIGSDSGGDVIESREANYGTEPRGDLVEVINSSTNSNANGSSNPNSNGNDNEHDAVSYDTHETHGTHGTRETRLDSGVSSPLYTDVQTPTEESVCVLSREHERKWAAFANLTTTTSEEEDSDSNVQEEADFQPVTDEEGFAGLFYNSDRNSLTSNGTQNQDNFNYPHRRESSNRDSHGSMTSEESFGAPHPYLWGCTSLSTIEEGASVATNALSLSMLLAPASTASFTSGGNDRDWDGTQGRNEARPSTPSGDMEDMSFHTPLPAPPPPQSTPSDPAEWKHAPPPKEYLESKHKANNAAQPKELEGTVRSVETQLRVKVDENAALAKRVAELAYALEQARTALAANEAGVDTLQDAYSDLESKYETLVLSSNADKRAYDGLNLALAVTKDKHAVEIHTLYKELNETKDKHATELTALNEKLEERERELAESRLESHTKDALISQLKHELETAKFAVDEANVFGRVTQEEKENALADLAEAVKAQENAWKTAGFFKEELDTQVESFAAERAKFAEERSSWAAWETERDEYDKRMLVLQKELEACDRKLNIEENRAYRAEEVTIPRLEERIECLTLLLRDATEGEMSLDDSMRSNDSAVNTLIDQETDLIALRRAVDAKDIELQDVTYQFERHKRACGRDLADLREDVASLNAEVKALKADLASTREREEMHRGRAAEYFQRNKGCLAELDRVNLISAQRMNELEALRAAASQSSLNEAALEKRVAHLEETRQILQEALQSKEFEIGMLKRQIPPSSVPGSPMRASGNFAARRHTTTAPPRSFTSPSPLRSSGFRSPTAPTSTPVAPAFPLPSRLKDKRPATDRDSPSPTGRKIRPKRPAMTPRTSPNRPFPEDEAGEAAAGGAESGSGSGGDGEGSGEGEAEVEVQSEGSDGSNEDLADATSVSLTIPSTIPTSDERSDRGDRGDCTDKTEKALTPTSKHNKMQSETVPSLPNMPLKKRVHSSPTPTVRNRPVSVLLARGKGGAPTPKLNAKQTVVTGFATS